jgi:hypothetical protein
MTRLCITLALFPILALASVSAQTITMSTNNAPRTQKSLTPAPGSLLFSAGPEIISDRIDVPSIKMGSTKTGYGGYVALDYFLSKALSLRSELSFATMGNETNVLSTVAHHGAVRTLEFHIPSRKVFHFDIGARYSPLQLTEYKNFPLQPFVKAALGGIVYTISDQSPGIGIDPCPFISAGGGADIAFNARWSATAEADYYSSISNTTLHTQGVQLTTRNDGILATVGIRYQF